MELGSGHSKVLLRRILNVSVGISFNVLNIIRTAIMHFSLGTKPGVYAQELMKNCGRLISNCNDDSVNSPLELLKLSVAETDSAGSSTVLIAHFDGQVL